MSETSHTESTGLSSAVYIIAFLILFAILVVFSDLFVFILGTIGLVVTFAAFYKDNSHADHH
jgi:regulator of protease activity HflC (stomatin/prohibitin superfamily)